VTGVEDEGSPVVKQHALLFETDAECWCRRIRKYYHRLFTVKFALAILFCKAEH
jgi:hypothetical protein